MVSVDSQCSSVCGGSPGAFVVEDLADTTVGTTTRDLDLSGPVVSPPVPSDVVLDGVYIAVIFFHLSNHRCSV